MKNAVIVAAVRTPIGRFQGALAGLSAVDLGASAVREVVRRAGTEPAAVEEVILGNVVGAGLGQNPARHAAIAAGMTTSVSALTVNKVCGSGLAAVALAAQAIRAGDGECLVAGGMESMSNVPYALPGARQGLRLGHSELKDLVVHDGLWCSMTDQHMGMTAELVADEYRVGRDEQDRYALESHRRAVAAWAGGHFDREVVAVGVPGPKGAVQEVARDEGPRADTSLEALGRLRPAFKREGGTVTAGNAPGLSDGAAALVLMEEERARHEGRTILARIRGYASGGVEPQWVMMAPVRATERVLSLTGETVESIDLYEINEAFAVQALAVSRKLRLPPDRVNVNGGAVALGHPIGASGARILVTLLHALEARGKRKGLAALCLGGGDAVAMVVERV